VTPTYDAAGNTTTIPQPGAPTSSYTAVYDAWNRMVKISVGASTVASYAYDGRNRRIVKVTISPSETRHFYFTNNWRDIEERVGTSVLMDQQHVWGMRYVDELVCRDRSSERLYALQDVGFNITALVGIAGTVQQRFLYDPYGTCAVLTATWTSSSDAYAWVYRRTGRELDTDTQIYHFRARTFHSGLGRFLTRDPIGQRDGANLYQSFGSNPIRFVDPSGRCKVCFSWQAHYGGITLDKLDSPYIGTPHKDLATAATSSMNNILRGWEMQIPVRGPGFYTDLSTGAGGVPVGALKNAYYEVFQEVIINEDDGPCDFRELETEDIVDQGQVIHHPEADTAKEGTNWIKATRKRNFLVNQPGGKTLCCNKVIIHADAPSAYWILHGNPQGVGITQHKISQKLQVVDHKSGKIVSEYVWGMNIGFDNNGIASGSIDRLPFKELARV
jgi:RHS repeat-associated protein